MKYKLKHHTIMNINWNEKEYNYECKNAIECFKILQQYHADIVEKFKVTVFVVQNMQGGYVHKGRPYAPDNFSLHVSLKRIKLPNDEEHEPITLPLLLKSSTS